MSPSCVIKLLFGSAALAVVGHLAQPFLGLDAAPAASLFSTGLFLGCVIGGLVSVRISSGASESDDAATVIYVGNLPFKASEDDVADLFEDYGVVHNVRLISGGPNRRPKGYGFVEMDVNGAKKAIKKLSGAEFLGRTLRVNEAKEKNAE
ncbi:MAG: RNA-binding protein [Mariprofundaceae bacterium]